MLDFLTDINYLGWFSFGLVLVLLELFIPGTYLLWFGLSAFAMGIIVSFFTLTATETGTLFALISVAFACVGWLIYGKLMRRAKTSEEYRYLNDTAGAHIGKIYNLSEDVVDGRAKAKVGDTFWLVEIQDDLKKGDRVKITGVKDGVVLKAEKYTEK